MVESMIRYSKSGSSDSAAKIRCHTPLRLQRLKRLKTLFHSPNVAGKSRQGAPVRTIQSTPSTNIRLLRPVEPRWSGRPMITRDPVPLPIAQNKPLRPQGCLPKSSLESRFDRFENPKSPQDLVGREGGGGDRRPNPEQRGIARLPVPKCNGLRFKNRSSF